MSDLVILVGGRGKRLGKITQKIPKPLIKINNTKFLDILLSKLIKYNFNYIYLLCSFKKKQFFNNYHKRKIHNSTVICIDEGKPKDTGGALFKIKKKIKKNFFLLNGDSFLDIDLNKLKMNTNSNIIGTMAITNNNMYKSNSKVSNLKIAKYGLVEFSKHKTNLMNAGIYFFKKKIFKYITNSKISLENDILKKIIKKKTIKGYYSKNNFIDIGTKRNLTFLKKKPYFFSPKAVFLDRDGVINKLKKNDYVKSFNEFKLLPGVSKGIRYLNKLQYVVVVITNQSCVGKSIITEKNLEDIHKKMKKTIFNQSKAIIDDIFYSPYYKFSKSKKYRINKFDRKPHPGMLNKAIKKWHLNHNDIFFIGDSISDQVASKKAGIKFYFKKNISLYKQLKYIINHG